jgi:hypothetical protein
MAAPSLSCRLRSLRSEGDELVAHPLGHTEPSAPVRLVIGLAMVPDSVPGPLAMEGHCGELEG